MPGVDNMEPAEGEDSGYDGPLDAAGHQFKVLLVEDDLFTLKCTSKLLQQCGYEVVNATNGKEALDLLSSGEDIDMVLTDVLMPEVSGLQLMDELRIARWRDIPVVAMSAESKQEVVLEALKGGAQDYLVKPVRRNELMTLWQHIWRSHQMQAARIKDAAAAPPSPKANGNSRPSSPTQQAIRPQSPVKPRPSTRRASSLPASLLDAAADAAIAEQPAAAVVTAQETILPGAHGLIPAASIPAVLAHPQIDLSIKPLNLSTQGAPQLPHPTAGVSGWSEWSDAQMRWMQAQSGNGQGFPDCLRELANLGSQMEAKRLHEAAERAGGMAGPSASADGLSHNPHSAFNAFTAFVPRPCPRGDATEDGQQHKRKREAAPPQGWPWPQPQPGAAGGFTGMPAYLHASPRAGSMPLPDLQPSQHPRHLPYSKPQQPQQQPAEQHGLNGHGLHSQALPQQQQQQQGQGAAQGLRAAAQAHQQDLEVQHQHFCSAFQAAVNRHHEMLAADGMPLDTTANRQAALAKFRAKRKARSFEKKVRYESRRRLAETRPRVRGQFVKGASTADPAVADFAEPAIYADQLPAAKAAGLPVAV